MDFKGYFATGDGSRCDPFTITEAHSRYLIRCQIAMMAVTANMEHFSRSKPFISILLLLAERI